PSPSPSLNGAPGMASVAQGSPAPAAAGATQPVQLTARPKAKPQTASPVKPKPAPPLPSLTAKSWRIQLVALSSRERAEEEWVKLQSTFRVLAHLRHRIESTENETTQTNLYRLQAGPFKDEVAARNACQSLKQVSQACTVVIPQL
ncbi:MAG: SPOR domain-containing protein, partial [Alphaproteobacteria bacterium]|nr:SPOR domain-containing protein [Alphaproteobacteria bacterium]